MEFLPKLEATKQAIIPLVEFSEHAAFQSILPYYQLKVAAGLFLEGNAPEPSGWIDVVKLGFGKRLSKGMFVTQVVGQSMEPTIKDGSLCVFRSPVEGARQGRVVLVQKRNFTDSETGGSYTIKRYQSTKTVNEDIWQHHIIKLVPDNPDRTKYPILEFTPEDDTDLQSIAEFIERLAPPE